MGRQQRKQKRWDGIIGIGDRVAFYMPGERWITAGEVMDVTLDQQTLTIGNLACAEGRSSHRVTTLETVGQQFVGSKPARGPSSLTITVQRGLVVENKTEVRRQEARERRKNKGKRDKYTPDRRPQESS